MVERNLSQKSFFFSYCSATHLPVMTRGVSLLPSGGAADDQGGSVKAANSKLALTLPISTTTLRHVFFLSGMSHEERGTEWAGLGRGGAGITTGRATLSDRRGRPEKWSSQEMLSEKTEGVPGQDGLSRQVKEGHLVSGVGVTPRGQLTSGSKQQTQTTM